MATTTSEPAARCLDLTRLISRVGRGPWTGIDRVEFEYLKALSVHDLPLFALVRLSGGYAVLEPAGTDAILARLAGRIDWGSPDSKSYLSRKSNAAHRRAVSDVRRTARAISQPSRLMQLIRQYLPAGTAYLNVGHSNISTSVFTAIRAIPNSQITVLLHDTIPLDFPQFQRPETVPAFTEKLRVIAQYADQIICISAQTRQDLLRHLAATSLRPSTTVAHLGVTLAKPRLAELPDTINQSRPYFVTIGTIEPRKNHTLLLNIWHQFADAPDAAHLFIIGQRGWSNRSVFDRLDRKPNRVTELNTLSDGAVAALLQGARAMLFPTLAEGFGLPACEAAALGVPLICNDLPVFHEVLGDYPIYADAADLYDWQTNIRKLAGNGGTTDNGECSSRQAVSVPTWDDHFNVVLRLT